MRKTFEYGSTGSAVLDAPEEVSGRSGTSKTRAAGTFRRAGSDPLRPTRSLVDDFADDEDTEAFLRASGRNRRLRRGLIPSSKYGRIAAGAGVLAVLGAIAAAGLAAVKFAMTNEAFRIPSSASIEIDGNSHLTRSQMLSVFGEDIERNIFKVPMDERRAQLEQMPWVGHATVERLLPNRIRVQVTERTPVAFVRQGGSIGMVDASGVLLDIPPDAPGNPNYSFPVVTGLKADDAPSQREQRMKLYASFLKDLDSEGKQVSAQLSEIDLSDPEDVKALIPDGNNEVLVHFGTDGFLNRYKKFEEHIAEWRGQYPHLGSVDMRYERQVVLQQLTPKEAAANAAPIQTASAAPAPAPAATEKPISTEKLALSAPAAKPAVVAASKPAAAPVPAKTVAAAVNKPAVQTPLTVAAVPPPANGKPVSAAIAAAAARVRDKPTAPLQIAHGTTAAPVAHAAVATTASTTPAAHPAAVPTATRAGAPVAAVPVSTAPVAKAPAAVHAAVAKPVAVAKAVHGKSAAKLNAKNAATAKRVEAIKAWMAKREKARAAAGTPTANAVAKPAASAGNGI